MDDRILVKLSVSEKHICFRTVSRERKSPREFYILRDEVLKLKGQSYLVAKDIYCFAELYREYGNRVTITFYWLDARFDDSVTGWKQTVSLPFDLLMDFAERGGRDGVPSKWKLLSLKDTFSPKIVFVDTQNLEKAVENAAVRRKLARALSRNFRYRNAAEVRLYNDFIPYSFLFQEMFDEGMGLCGGLILHGQDNLETAKYSIHT